MTRHDVASSASTETVTPELAHPKIGMMPNATQLVKGPDQAIGRRRCLSAWKLHALERGVENM